MKKLLFSLLIAGMIFILASSVYAKDVAYIVTNQPEAAFTSTLEELGMSYDVIFHTQLTNLNFSNYKAILLNNDYFVNWNKIPINNKPALIASSYHLSEWGWAVRTTEMASTMFINVNINQSHEIAKNFPQTINAYNKSWTSLYFLDKMDIYDGFEYVATSPFDNKDVVVAAARNGTVLKKSGKPDTYVNANSVYFGIYDSRYWTNETKELFKNSLLWLVAQPTFNISLKTGKNLVSFPLILDSNNASSILNQDIISVKEYDNGIIRNASQIVNNKGYFVEAARDVNLSISGKEPSSIQNVSLQQGMNLVGITTLNNMSLTSLPSGIIEVSRRKQDGSYDIATKYGSSWFNSFDLEPGKGYWFKTNSSLTWSYNP